MSQPLRHDPDRSRRGSKRWALLALLLVCGAVGAALVGVLWHAGPGPLDDADATLTVLPYTGEEDGQPDGDPHAQSDPTTGLDLGSDDAPLGDLGLKGRSGEAIPHFFISADGESWGSTTTIDVFSSYHTNGNGDVTVQSADGDKVVAPGTEDTYRFYLVNGGRSAVDYQMRVTATLSDGLKQYTVPVQARLSNHEGTWLCGSPDAWETFATLDGSSEDAVLGGRSYSYYTLDWRWPYDSGDHELDTLLGTLAATDDLRLTVDVDIRAEYDPDPNAEGGLPLDSPLGQWLLRTLGALGLRILPVMGDGFSPELVLSLILGGLGLLVLGVRTLMPVLALRRDRS